MDTLSKENLEKLIQDTEYVMHDKSIPWYKRRAALDLNTMAIAYKILLLKEELNYPIPQI
jgi:hypothetical protein